MNTTTQPAKTTRKPKAIAKYRISELIGRYADSRSVRTELKETLGITSATLSQWENAAKGDLRTIEGSHLQKLAKYFGVEVKEMFN